MLHTFSHPSSVQNLAGVGGDTDTTAGSQVVDCQLSPAEMAARMAEEEGFVWLDSAVAAPGALSYLTARPDRVLTGQMCRDWHLVEAALAAGTAMQRPGGLFGWVGFDGQFVLGDYPHVLAFDHSLQQWSQQGHLLSSLPKVTPRPASSDGAGLSFTPLVTREAFEQRVRRAQEYITAGDIYQVNLSLPWQARWPDDQPFLPFYERLRRVSPAPHAACLRFADTTVFSASPELFLHLSDRTITTRPIKGTRPRFPEDPARDVQAARELLACDKERAELLMITDLERNDLGQVCAFGSVQTPDLWRVESFAQVYHLVSTVTGCLQPDLSHASAFRACFPGGSISGAPKKRALEIIAELETHPRGLYTGAIGYFGFQGQSQWNIAIRTAVQQAGEIRFHVGSGIVADSLPAREWEETCHKASGLLKAWS